MRAHVFAYGAHPDQHLLAWDVPCAVGTVALIHGGFWRERYDVSLMTPLATDLVQRGWAVANIEYRRVGEQHPTGFPVVLDDILAAAGTLPCAFPTGMARPLVLVGHSAGGQLALWVAGRLALDARREPAVDGVISQAGVVDLHAAAREDLGRGAVRELLGGRPQEQPQRYASACPRCRLPLGIPQLLIHGKRDEHVPWELSAAYHAGAVEKGDSVTLALLDEMGHFEHLDPAHRAWREAITWLTNLPRVKPQRRPLATGASK